MNLRDRVNTQIRQTNSNENHRLSSHSKREKFAGGSEERETPTQKSIDTVMSNMKSYFEQVLQPQIMGDVLASKHFSKRIETIIEF
jgi:hypothetical protein